jgi:hypothetical protein
MFIRYFPERVYKFHLCAPQARVARSRHSRMERNYYAAD